MGRGVPVTQMGLALPTDRPVVKSAMRVCASCRDAKPELAFSKDASCPDGIDRRCKECQRKRKGREQSPRTHHVPACHACSADGLRFCGRCKQHKTRDHFRPVPGSRYGVHARCIQCDNDRRREKVIRVSGACTVCGATFLFAKINGKRQRKTCGEPECVRENMRRISREKLMRDVYGITEDDYQRMFREQSGKCAICGTTNPGHPLRAKSDRMCVDHDHATGRVRGLLCSPCNMGLGHFGDNSERMASAVRYLLSHKG